jgi:hypothetical protein
MKSFVPISSRMTQVTQEKKNNTSTVTLNYTCGCSYLFDHHIELEHICSEHESQLTTHG